MEVFEDPFDGLYPEWKLLNFLSVVGEILNCEHSWDVDSLCYRMEQVDLDPKKNVVLNLNNDSVTLDNAEVKNILLFDNELKSSLEIFLKVLLKFLSAKIENVERENYEDILYFVKELCSFVKACEKNSIVIPIKSYVTKFLSGLIYILETADAFNFLDKGPVYQFVVKVVGYFKKIEFSKSFVITEISKKLKTFYNHMVKVPKNNFDMSYYEILLLYLMILKEILEYNLQESILKPPAKSNKKEDNALVDVSEKLTNMLDKVPDYVAIVIHDCLNLLS